MLLFFQDFSPGKNLFSVFLTNIRLQDGAELNNLNDAEYEKAMNRAQTTFNQYNVLANSTNVANNYA